MTFIPHDSMMFLCSYLSLKLIKLYNFDFIIIIIITLNRQFALKKSDT